MASSSKQNVANRSREKKTGLFHRIGRLWRNYANLQTLQLVTLNPEFIWLTAIVLLAAEVVINLVVINRVPYTEIDWKAYMQEVEGFVNGTFNYGHLKGDTGPLVYPAGFVYIFTILYYLTNRGSNIYLAQHIFALLYIASLVFVFRIYQKTKKIPPYVLLFLCCTSYRIHSIYVLRLFNDSVAVFFLYIALNLFLNEKWVLGSIVYSFAVSIKMNILLFSPALLILMLATHGLFGTFKLLTLCASVQIILGLPFLLADPWSYIRQSFDLGRVFLYQWTVNWRFLDESIFVSRYFHLILLALHVIVLILFIKRHWIKLIPSIKHLKHVKLSPNSFILPMFTANLIGVAFSRSLHYQFYVWYFHTLPYLLWSTQLSSLTKICILGVLELCWNTYPSTWWSSGALHLCHVILLSSLFWTQSQPVQLELKRRDRRKDD